MPKLMAILNVIAWSGFWAFGYLAFTADPDGSQVFVAGFLAVIGAGVGIFAYLQLVRHNEATGYAKPRNRAVPEHMRDAEGESV